VSNIQCTNCHHNLSQGEVDYRCPICGGDFDYAESLKYDVSLIDKGQPGIWRYRYSFGLPDGVTPISLGEGNSPLVWDEVNGKQVAFKLDYLNPTGSYKDRGTTVLISYLNWLDVEAAIEDSSGNAGASFAAYASRSGIQGKVFVPAYASGPKRAQIEAYGIDLVQVPGPRSSAAEAVEREAEKGAIYASHVYQPYVLPGYATVVYEILDQMGAAPGAVIAPVGQGSFLLGMARGFEALLNSGLISQIPQLVGVQSRACAPLWAIANYGEDALDHIIEGETIAEGIRISQPLRGDKVLETVKSSQGLLAAVEEHDIIPARDELASRGFYVEPTSAVVWPALLENIDRLNDPIVVVLTGSGLKYSPS
jgi:threonine synthase